MTKLSQQRQAASGRKRAADPPGAASPHASRPSKQQSRQGAAGEGAAQKTTYHGVTHHVRTGRFEAHIWQGGKQVYLGGYETAELAALAFDIAAVRCRGLGGATTNFHSGHYELHAEELATHTVEQVVAGLRKRSKGLGALQSSIYRGVTRHAKGRWEARIGAVGGRRYQYLGLHDTEVAAAMVYDRAAIAQRGVDACTNFHLAEYLVEGLLDEGQIALALQRGILSPGDLAPQAPQLEGSQAAQLSGAPAAAGGGPDTPSGSAGLGEASEHDRLAESLLECIMGGEEEGAPSPQTVLLHLPQEQPRRPDCKAGAAAASGLATTHVL